MPVLITCPTCGTEVQLLAHGFVQMHGGSSPCSFVRTPFTNARGGKTSRATVEKRAAAKAEKAAAAAELQANLVAAKAAKAKQQLENPRVLCAKCESKVHLVDGSTMLYAHLRSDSNRWCSGGVAPTDAERKKELKGKRKKSVWAVSGGLPTLGRRR
jgi:hypothetical protein